MTGGRGFVVKEDRESRTHRSGRKPLLDCLDVELTERCDSNCIHCYINLPAGDPRVRARELPAGDWMRIFREAAGLGALTIRMTGGEPLLRDDFPELYLFARRLGLKVSLFTNARRITPELADLLARVPPLERVEVTVYGMREETYEAVTRVPGSYAGFRRGVALLLDRKVPFVVKGAILPPNRGELDEFETWAATLPSMERSPSCSMFFDLRARRDSEEKNRRIRALRLSPEEGVAFFARNTGKLPPGDGAVLRQVHGGDRRPAVRVRCRPRRLRGRVRRLPAVHAPPRPGCRLRPEGGIAARSPWGGVSPASGTAFREPGIPGPLRALFPEGSLRTVPCQVVGRARNAGHPR